MKKFLLLFPTVALATLSVSAFTHDEMSQRHSTARAVTEFKMEFNREKLELHPEFRHQQRQHPSAKATQKSLKVQNLNLPPITATRADNSQSIEGYWTFTFGDFYWEEGVGVFQTEMEATVNGDYVFFQDPDGYYFPLVGEYDAATGEIEFAFVLLGMSNGYLLYQEPFIYDYDKEDADYVDFITAQYIAAEGVINFQQDSGIMWSSYIQTPEGELEYKGFFDAFDLLGATYNGTEDSRWQDVGEVLFMDGWLCPIFDIDQTQAKYQVPIQRNVDNPYIYRLVDPYHIGPIAPFNSSTKKGSINFDISDPDHVLFIKADAGFANPELGILSFFCYNTLGSLYTQYANSGIPLKELIKGLQGQIPFTTFKDGVVYLGSFTDEDGLFYDANFGTQQMVSGGYTWVDDNDEPLNMTASITIPAAGVESINSDNYYKPVYYNLLGQKVENPEKGQILIEKRGSKTKKVVF